MKPNKKFYSLKFKFICGITLLCLALTIIMIIYINNITRRLVDDQYATRADLLAYTVAASINAEDVYNLKQAVNDIYIKSDPVLSDEWGSDEFNKYMSLYSDIETRDDFVSLRDTLRIYQDVNKVDCAYIWYVDTQKDRVIYLVDGAYEDECPPGCADILYEVNYEVKKHPEIGFPAYITNTKAYGWLVTAGAPIYYNNEVIAYAVDDISMNMIKAEADTYVIIASIAISVVMIIAIIVMMFLVNKYLLQPLSALSNTAINYCADKNNIEHHNFKELKVGANDEIAQLLTSMQQMERDMNNNIKKLLSTKQELQITTEIALKDGLTHVGNKTAYDRKVQQLDDNITDPNMKFGIVMIDLNYLKKINDKYGHAQGNIAIQTLCRMVCDVFAHSPVYRIGGDEFVVIVQNRDYENVHDLLHALQKAIKHNAEGINEPYLRVSAAVGYAQFDRIRDKDVKAVYERADALMYENKKKMHAVRTD